jgi:hypothetical protein
MVEGKTSRIHSISANRNEYDRHKTLLNNSLKEVLDDTKISQALKHHSIEKFTNTKRVYHLSDHSDIRKEYSKKMENLGKVRALKGDIINGFTTLGSVVVDENKKDVTLMDVTVFSNKEDRFITQEELKKYVSPIKTKVYL